MQLDYRLTLLEIQKLAYFLQEAGEPLRLRYEPGIYGPYAPNLNKVLEVLEGHLIRGYGDTQKPDVEIELLPGAVEEADRFLGNRPDVRGRLDRVGSLIAGFETPYGMELLASVHWIACHDPIPAANAESAVQRIGEWSNRKARMFKPDHIRVAWNRLASQDWIPPSNELPPAERVVSGSLPEGGITRRKAPEGPSESSSGRAKRARGYDGN